MNEAERIYSGADGQIVSRQLEMSRRLRISIAAFNASSDKWSVRLFALSVVLVVFTAVLIVIAIETAYLAWVLLERGG